MSVDDSRDSNPCAVRSKYFTYESAMDESLSDFQEPKKSSTGPKNTAKTKNSKPKKALKRIRGQKDIRKALNSKNNDLESYSKDFDKVCKRAGLDVDSEQLQLAIALSKSLQETTSTSSEPSQTTQVLNTQERIGKIRTTLQEYGFKVPEIKIAVNIRKQRKIKRNYKLIETSETEKKEIIANKYSQILFQDISHCSLYYSDIDSSDIPLYYLASNVTYDVLKNIDTFYVNQLIEKSTSRGNLLRDWTEIPGRPVSPKLFEPSNMNFSEIECSQDELDIVLSGSLKRCKTVLSNKNKDLLSDNICEVAIDRNVDSLNNEKNIGNTDEVNIIDHDVTLNDDNNSKHNNYGSILTENRNRSYSPDLFDDDAILDSSKNSTVQEINPDVVNAGTKTDFNVMDLAECVQQKTSKFQEHALSSLQFNSNETKRKSNDLMEITECVQSQSKYFIVINKPGSQLISSQNTNITKRKSNDFMEITECVNHLKPIQDINIDLTHSHDITEENKPTGEVVKPIQNMNIDLTQSHITDENKASGEIDLEQNDKYFEESQVNSKVNVSFISPTKGSNIDLTESPENYNVEANNKTLNPDKSIESLDLTQSSNTSDELPFVSLTAKDSSLDKTIIVNYDYADINKRKTILQKETDAHIDLTQYSGRVEETGNQSQSFFEEFNHDHSDEPKENNSGNKSSSSGKDLTKGRKSGHSNSHREPSKNNVEEDSSDSLSEFNDIIQSNIEKASASLNEQSLSVEYHNCNMEFRPCKPGNIDLTQKSPEIHLQSKRRDRSKRSIESNSSSAENSNNLDSPRTRNVNTQSMTNTDNDNIIIEEVPLPVEQLPCNFGFKPITPGKVDLTQSPSYKSPRRIEANNSMPSSSQNISLNFNVDYRRSQENMSSTNHIRPNVDSSRIRLLNCSCTQSEAANVNVSISPIQKNDNEINDDEMNDIDLTQSSDSEELSQALYASKEDIIGKDISTEYSEQPTSKKSQRCSSLGKKDDVSIDYDDFINNAANQLNNSNNTSSKSVIHGNLTKLSKNDSFASNCSQSSEVFEISDKELDYSLHQSKLDIPGGNFVFGGISIMDDFSDFGTSKKSSDLCNNFANNDAVNDVIEFEINNVPTVTYKQGNRCKEISPIKHRRITEIATPQKASSSMFTVVTPKNSELIIKTNNVTPMLDYESMSMPEIHNELDKYGIKPFKRKRAIQLLTHIYNQTHPVIEDLTEFSSPPKRHKPNEQPDISPRKLIFPSKNLKSPEIDLELDIREYINVPGTTKDNVINKNKSTENRNRHKTNEHLDLTPRKLISSRKNNKSSDEELGFDIGEEYRNVPGTSKNDVINKNNIKENSKSRKTTKQLDLTPTKLISYRKNNKTSDEELVFDIGEEYRNVPGTRNDNIVSNNKSKENRKRHKTNKQPDLTPRKFISSRKNYKSSNEDLGFDIGEEYRNVPHTKAPITKNKKECSKKGQGKGKRKNIGENQDNQSTIEIIETNYIESTQRRSRDEVGGVTEALISTEIICKPEDWVFQKREKAKVHSCRVPLHVAFHNYVMSRRDLREAILCYEPVEIDIIHKDLVAYGHRYDPKDLLKFLDKKCITVKTTDNDARNNKRS